ncbi:MAG: hypothetical protein FWH35_01450 [Treponema sp.]|nr:hypothetical protein [Treponema sp.]
MKRYCIKCREGKMEFFDIVGENDDGYNIRLTRLCDGSEKIMEETIPRHLFNICLKTGYIFEMNSAVA